MEGVACHWHGTHVDSEDNLQESFHSLTMWVPLIELSHISRNLYPLSHFDCADLPLNSWEETLFDVYSPGVSVQTDPRTLYYYSPFNNVACLSASQRPCAGSLKTNPRCQWKIMKDLRKAAGHSRRKWCHWSQALGSDVGNPSFFSSSSFAPQDHWH